MKQKRKVIGWIILLVAVVLVCVGGKMWYDRLCGGTFRMADSMPDTAMLLHILDHRNELAARNDLFRVDRDGETTIVHYVGNPAYEYANIHYYSGAADALTDPAATLEGTARYYRSNLSDFWDIVLPWSTLNLNILISQQPGAYAILNIQDLDAPAVSDAALREMLDAVVSVIGAP